MRIRLTTIALACGGRLHPIGAELEVGTDVPADVAEARLRARTAEPVDGEARGLAPEGDLGEAIARWLDHAQATRRAAQSALELAMAQGDGARGQVVDAVDAILVDAAPLGPLMAWLMQDPEGGTSAPADAGGVSTPAPTVGGQQAPAPDGAEAVETSASNVSFDTPPPSGAEGDGEGAPPPFPEPDAPQSSPKPKRTARRAAAAGEG